MTDPSSDVLKVPINKTRLEFLYDGVFAIAMTILVLELKIPELEQRRSGTELLHKLAHNAPAFGSWLISIAMLGVFWYHHQRVYRWIERISRPMLLVHLGLMATAAFFPFCAAMIGHYPGNRLAMLLYMGCAWVHVVLIWTLWVIAERTQAIAPQLDAAAIRAIRRRYIRGPLAMAIWAVAYFLLMPRL